MVFTKRILVSIILWMATFDGKSFLALNSNIYIHVPTYNAIISVNDAICVPSWICHCMNYIPLKSIKIRTSSVHFQAQDFIRNLAFFAVFITPADVDFNWIHNKYIFRYVDRDQGGDIHLSSSTYCTDERWMLSY